MMQKQLMLTVGLCSLMSVGLLLFSTDQAHAASGNGPYYAEPSWSQKLPAATRFVVLLDWSSQAVLDRETGLVWEQSPATTAYEGVDARFACLNRTTGGRKGWRSASVHELTSLIDPSVAPPGPTLPMGHPFTNVASPSPTYWSATANSHAPTNGWFVNFANGFVFHSPDFTSFRVWCVRGGMNADAY
jgi:Protein of unknown function (DUF1566)